MITQIKIERQYHDYYQTLIRDDQTIKDRETLTRDRAMEIIGNNPNGRTEDGHAPDFRPIATASWVWRAVDFEPIDDPRPVSAVALFVELNGFGYDGSGRAAAFRSQDAADKFRQHFPEWTAYAINGRNGSG
jgi:hypothetical protein